MIRALTDTSNALTGSAAIPPTVNRGLSDDRGFWKTIRTPASGNPRLHQTNGGSLSRAAHLRDDQGREQRNA